MLKRILPHILVLLIAVLYCVLGAWFFHYIESRHQSEQNEMNITEEDKSGVVLESGVNMSTFRETLEKAMHEKYNPSQAELDEIVGMVLDAMGSSVIKDDQKNENETVDEWSFGSSVLFAFSVITTIGYGHVSPSTLTSKIFCIFYALIGIPLTLICLANLGQFLNAVMNCLRKKLLNLFHQLRKKYSPHAGQKNGIKTPDKPCYDCDDSLMGTSVATVVIFVLWVVLGMTYLPVWEALSHSDAAYFSVISLTTVGFGDIYPNYDTRWLFPTLIYIFIGLAITTMTLDIIGALLKKLHHFGQKLHNVARTGIWIGGDRISVGNLVSGVMTQAGVEPDKLDKCLANLDSMVSNVAAGNVLPEKPAPDETNVPNDLTPITFPQYDFTPFDPDPEILGMYIDEEDTDYRGLVAEKI